MSWFTKSRKCLWKSTKNVTLLWSSSQNSSKLNWSSLDAKLSLSRSQLEMWSRDLLRTFKCRTKFLTHLLGPMLSQPQITITSSALINPLTGFSMTGTKIDKLKRSKMTFWKEGCGSKAVLVKVLLLETWIKSRTISSTRFLVSPTLMRKLPYSHSQVLIAGCVKPTWKPGSRGLWPDSIDHAKNPSKRVSSLRQTNKCRVLTQWKC